MTFASKEYILGRCVFRLTSQDTELLEPFDKLFECYTCNDDSQAQKRIDLEINLDEIDGVVNTAENIPYEQQAYSAINYVISEATSCHQNCIWLDAAAVMGPDGKPILLAGPSFAGKTTLTLALAYAKSWKVVSEDLTLIDCKESRLVPLARPSCFRPGTAEALAEFTQINTGSLVSGQWLFNKQMFLERMVDAKFGLAIVLDKIKQPEPDVLSVSPVQSGELIRKLLPLSNLLRMDRGLAEMENALKDADCYMIRGGKTEQRMRAILQMLANSAAPGAGD